MLTDAELLAVWDGQWEIVNKGETIPQTEARALRAVYDAAVAEITDAMMQ